MASIVLAGATSGSTTITPTDAVTATVTLPSTGGTLQTSGAGFTTNGVAYATSTSALTTGSGLVFTGTNLGIGVTPSTQYSGIKSLQLGSTTNLFDTGTGTKLYHNAYTSVTGDETYLTTGYAQAYLMLSNGQHIWYTAASGTAGATFSYTQPMTLDASGNLLVGTTSVDSAGSKFQLSSTQNRVFTIQNSANVNGDQGLWIKLGSNCNTTASPAFICDTGGTNRLLIYGNGNVVNTNNSYGAISDVKLKENIVDATPKLADLMQVKVRNYNLKSDPDHKQLGVVAQELETVFPSMIEESPDRDADGNALETTTKSVKYSVFVPMLIKAIQEQQSTITSLTERITALEGK
jgi:Chaperone of endosialidase